MLGISVGWGQAPALQGLLRQPAAGGVGRRCPAPLAHQQVDSFAFLPQSRSSTLNSMASLSPEYHRRRFSYLGVPAAAGMSDWYESTSRTPIRDSLTQGARSTKSSRHIPHSREGMSHIRLWRAGIQRGEGRRGNSGNQSHLHPLVCRRKPASVIGTKACPGPRSGMTFPVVTCML